VVQPGIDMHRADHLGQTPLHAAVLHTYTRGHVLFNALLQHRLDGVPENVRPSLQSLTPATPKTKGFSPDTTFEMLHKFGCFHYPGVDMGTSQLKSEDIEGMDPVDYAVANTKITGLVKELLAGKYTPAVLHLLNLPDTYGRTPLWYAAATNQVGDIYYLLRKR
jgi:ankyrin repeat protein